MYIRLPVKNIRFRLYVLCLICLIVLFGSCAYNQNPANSDKPLAPGFVSFKSTSLADRTFTDPLNLTGRIKKPAGQGPFPAVVLMHGCGGMQPKRDNRWAERLSSWGYVTLELDSFGPRGISSVCTYSGSASMDIIQRRVSDAYDAKRYLADLPFVDRNRIAVMGWSHGGITTLQVLDLNVENPFRVAVAFYPSCRMSLSGLNAPLLILIGEADDWTPASQCVSAMPKEKTSHELALKVYPGAYHGFDLLGANINVQGSNGSHHLQYQPEAEADSIIQVKAFFEKYLLNK